MISADGHTNAHDPDALPAEADVLVIGGGVVGLCVGHFLLKAGRQVTILDRGEIGTGSTAGNAGHIVPSHVTPLAAPGVVPQALRWMLTSPTTSPFTVRPRPSLELLDWLLRFLGACSPSVTERGVVALRALCEPTPAVLGELLEDEGIACFHEQAGLLNVYKTDEGLRAAAEEAKLLEQRGVPVALLDQAALHELQPGLRSDVIGALLLRGDSHMDPGLFLQGLVEGLRRREATLCPDTEAISFAMSNGRVHEVRTSRGNVRPREVVLAAGAWSAQIARALGFSLSLQAGKGYSITFRRPPMSGPHLPMILGEPKVAVTAFGPLLRATGRLEITAPNLAISTRWLERIESSMRNYLTVEGDLEVVGRWAGLRPTSPDGLPFIGRPSGLRNLTVATGHAMLGLTLAPVTGRTVAQLIAGETPDIDVRPYGVQRFRWGARRIGTSRLPESGSDRGRGDDARG